MWFSGKESSSLPTRYIFSINTGRAGSAYLAKLLGTAKEVVAFHEPIPQMTGEMLRLVTEKSYESTFPQRLHKAIEIKSVIDRNRKKVYVETTHMFIKTFFDVAVRELENVHVVYLKRNLEDTLYSFEELGYFSNRNAAWQDWMISPYATTAAIPCPVLEKEQDSVGLSIAYLFDMYARAEKFKTDYSHIPVHEIELKELNHLNVVEQLFNELRLTVTNKTKRVTGEKTNIRSERKKALGNYRPDREYLRQRIQEYIAKLGVADIAVPKGIVF